MSNSKQELVEEGDGAITFEEAIAFTAGSKINNDPLKPPLKADRRLETPEINLGDLPFRSVSGQKVVLFCDVHKDEPLYISEITGVDTNPEACQKKLTKFLNETVFELFCQCRFKELPLPLRLRSEPAVPYTLQLFVLPTADPSKFDILGEACKKSQLKKAR
jgi:hypothetical protein